MSDTQTAPTSLICPHCQKKLRFKKTPAEGSRFNCPHCQGGIQYSSYDPNDTDRANNGQDAWFPSGWVQDSPGSSSPQDPSPTGFAAYIPTQHRSERNSDIPWIYRWTRKVAWLFFNMGKWFLLILGVLLLLGLALVVVATFAMREFENLSLIPAYAVVFGVYYFFVVLVTFADMLLAAFFLILVDIGLQVRAVNQRV